jgi:ATP-dependent Clp protease ATP-binding subunit ClpA
MTFEKFLAAVLDDARREAGEDGSATVEPQHLLLAIAFREEPSTHHVLSSVGLDHTTVRAALDRESERSLAAAGVSLAAVEVARPRQAREQSPKVGSSFRRVMERSAGSAGRRAPQPLHLLLGIVAAPVGTVPRALALAGVDRAGLVERIRQAIAVQA